jgi:hypothetical protein
VGFAFERIPGEHYTLCVLKREPSLPNVLALSRIGVSRGGSIEAETVVSCLVGGGLTHEPLCHINLYSPKDALNPMIEVNFIVDSNDVMGTSRDWSRTSADSLSREQDIREDLDS